MIRDRRMGWAGTCATPQLDGSMADANQWSADCYHTPALPGLQFSGKTPSPLVPLPAVNAAGGVLTMQSNGALSYVIPAATATPATPTVPPPLPIPAAAPAAAPSILSSVPWWGWAAGAGALFFLWR